MSDEYLDVLRDFPNQIKAGYSAGKDIKIDEEIDKIIFVGMGGSSIAGQLIQTYLSLKIPIFVCKDYALPEFINRNSLVFAVSYSGNTEETISAFNEAFRRGAKLVAIASGGKLAEFCLKRETPFIRIPSGMQPRAAIAYMFFPILNVLFNSGLIPNQDKFVKETLDALRDSNVKEKAEELAEKLVNKVPLIYASEKFAAVAYRWKTQFNELAKIHAFFHVFPELNHNELVGYGKLNADYYVIMLQDEADNRKIKQRMRLTKDMIAKRGAQSTLINITGNNLLARMFFTINLGDFTGFFLAQKLGADPMDIEIIEELKRKLKKL